MELLRVFATLWQRRLLVLLGVALALAVVAKAPGSGAGATAGTALARVLVDTPNSMLVDVGPRGANASGMRTALLADKMMAGEVKAKIARAAGVPDDELLMRGASSDPPLVPGPLAQSASIATAGVTAPYAISVRPEAQVPIIEISVYAPDAASAARVASAATDTLESLNTAPEGDTSGAVVESLGPPLSQEIVAAESRKMAVIAAVILFASVRGDRARQRGRALVARAGGARRAGAAGPARRGGRVAHVRDQRGRLRPAARVAADHAAAGAGRAAVLAAAATSARGSIASARGTFAVARVAVTARGGKMAARGDGAAVRRRRRPRRSLLRRSAASSRASAASSRRRAATSPTRVLSEGDGARRAAGRERAGGCGAGASGGRARAGGGAGAGRLAARERAAAAEHAWRAAARDRVARRADGSEAHGKQSDRAHGDTAADRAAARAAAERAEQTAEHAAAERGWRRAAQRAAAEQAAERVAAEQAAERVAAERAAAERGAGGEA